MTFDEYLFNYEAAIRLGFFFSIFALMALWEIFFPRRQLLLSRGLRWTSNLALAVLNSLILRLLFPAAAVGAALFARENGLGLFNMVETPTFVSVVICVLTMDLAIYWQHVVTHYFPVLWRLHRVHHADLDFDITTAARFHSVEIVLSMLLKFVIVILLGAPALAVIIFEIILSGTAIFNHSNARLPAKLDGWLRLLIVTPDMHRVHHSVIKKETNSNYGFNLSIWDRLFGSYIDQPAAGHGNMTIGLVEFKDTRQTNHLLGMLKMPFIANSNPRYRIED